MNLLKQGAFFTIISGIGWCMDFGLFSLLSIYAGVPVSYANILSSIPAVTFVFCFATRHIFKTRAGGMSLKQKYVVYLVYQLILVTSVSYLALWLYDYLAVTEFFAGLDSLLKILVKFLITPITMICNFCVMKILAERA